jgi:hypothetical protein
LPQSPAVNSKTTPVGAPLGAADTATAVVDTAIDANAHNEADDTSISTNSAAQHTDEPHIDVHSGEQLTTEASQQQQLQEHTDTAPTAVAATGSHEIAETLDSSQEQLQEQPFQQDATSAFGESQSLIDESTESSTVAVVAVDSGSGELQTVREAGSSLSGDSSVTDGSVTAAETVTAVVEASTSINSDNTQLEPAAVDDSTGTAETDTDNDADTTDRPAAIESASEAQADKERSAAAVAVVAGSSMDTDTAASKDEPAAVVAAVDERNDGQNDATAAATATAAGGSADSTDNTDAAVGGSNGTAASTEAVAIKITLPEPASVEVRACCMIGEAPVEVAILNT